MEDKVIDRQRVEQLRQLQYQDEVTLSGWELRKLLNIVDYYLSDQGIPWS